MLSATTSRYSISVNRSIYAAVFVFLFYCFIIFLLLYIFDISALTFPFFILLLAVATYGARKIYQQRYDLTLCDSGAIEVSLLEGVVLFRGLINDSSFYNALFLSLHMQKDPDDFSNLSSSKKYSIVIYRDAVSESDYRLLARLISFGR